MALPCREDQSDRWSLDCQGWVWLEVSAINCGNPIQGMKTLMGWGHPLQLASSLGSARLRWVGGPLVWHF